MFDLERKQTALTNSISTVKTLDSTLQLKITALNSKYSLCIANL